MGREVSQGSRYTREPELGVLPGLTAPPSPGLLRVKAANTRLDNELESWVQLPHLVLGAGSSWAHYLTFLTFVSFSIKW